MTAANVIAVLNAEDGYHEKSSSCPLTAGGPLYQKRSAYDGSGNYTKYHAMIGVAQGQDWCGFFAFWAVFQASGSILAANDYLHNIAYYGGATSSWANAFSAVNKWHPRGDGYRPKAGDIAIYEDDGIPWSHVEFITSVSSWPSTMTCVGGNTRRPQESGSQALGRWVSIRTRHPSATSGFRVKGYCEMDYDDSPGPGPEPTPGEFDPVLLAHLINKKGKVKKLYERTGAI